MNHHDIKAFAQRNWAQVPGFDRTYWANEYRRHGFTATQKASQALWLHMKNIRSSWPDTTERKRDLDDHIALKQLLDQTAHDLTPHKTVG